MNEDELIGIFFAVSGSRGDRILFKYPYFSLNNYYYDDIDNDYHAIEYEEISSIILKSRYRRLHDYNSSKTNHKFIDLLLATFLCVKSESYFKLFEVKIDDVNYVGYPFLLKIEMPENKIQSFNIVFAFKTFENTKKTFLSNNYQMISKNLAIILQNKQFENEYLTNNIRKMFHIIDEYSVIKDCEKLENINPYKIMLDQNVNICIVIKDIYENLCKDKCFNIKIENTFFNLYIPLNIKLANSYDTAQLPCDNLIKPFHSILLNDNISTKKLLYQNMSLNFLNLCVPTKSLYKISIEANISLNYILDVIKQLVHLGQCRIIYPLCETNIYVITPQITEILNASLIEKFNKQIDSNTNLVHILEIFSHPFTLIYHYNIAHSKNLLAKFTQDDRIKIIVWLIRHELIIQLHTYIYLKPSSGSSNYEEKFISPAPKSQIQNLYSSEKEVSQDVINTLRPAKKYTMLFKKLMGYFNGLFHIEEIMFLEHIKRSTLMSCLENFKDSLIFIKHYDDKLRSIENNKDDVNTPEFKIKHLVIVLTKLKLPVQTTLDIPKRRREENDLDTLIYIPKDHIKSLPSTNLDISSITFNKNDDSQQNEHTKSLINIENQNFNDELDIISNNLPPTSENQNFNDELDTISNNLPPTSENQNFNDELDTISNNLPLTSEIPRYSIKNYDKNKLNTLDHFKSLPSISSITLKKNDSSQQNIIGCINLEFKEIPTYSRKLKDNRQPIILDHLEPSPTTSDIVYYFILIIIKSWFQS
ncbi:GATOR1 complex protein NPRL3-like [Gordionus sp. m RMFG-2023]|uniref:GATOR1 complex protein NPRL3-like n=1 Tax=Gordionus sp. m RMFG-2023 TaxID=3053472 RepID=UPI0031FDA491